MNPIVKPLGVIHILGQQAVCSTWQAAVMTTMVVVWWLTVSSGCRRQWNMAPAGGDDRGGWGLLLGVAVLALVD